jgi:hypothetical protein
MVCPEEITSFAFRCRDPIPARFDGFQIVASALTRLSRGAVPLMNNNRVRRCASPKITSKYELFYDALRDPATLTVDPAVLPAMKTVL